MGRMRILGFLAVICGRWTLIPLHMVWMGYTRKDKGLSDLADLAYTTVFQNLKWNGTILTCGRRASICCVPLLSPLLVARICSLNSANQSAIRARARPRHQSHPPFDVFEL
ncbi:hypothetical protein F4819DRAFT_364140 [Hypoxylon fuscum]|nr:hypothetical protein F4819DRAFT_364140 [Hypoxylon fuscum]